MQMAVVLDTPPPSPPREVKAVPGVATAAVGGPDDLIRSMSSSERVADEIVTTERAYVKSLEDIVKGYKEPIIVYIQSCGLPVAEEDVSALFGNAEELLALNSDLLAELETCGNNPTRIAEAFVTRAADFSVYSSYCTNYPRAVAILTLWQHTPRVTENSPKVTQFLKLCQTRLRHALPLGAFLIKPVQRILKYHLLWREMAKCCKKDTNSSNTIVQSALDAMSSIADHINTMKRRHEAAVYIQEIQSQLSGWEHDDISSYGDLLLEDSFKVKGAKSERRVFLFQRLLLLVKKKGEHLQYKGSIPIDAVTVGDFVGTGSPSFVVTELSNQSNTFELEARTNDIRSRWTTAIKHLMLNAHSPPEEPPLESTESMEEEDRTEEVGSGSLLGKKRGSLLSRRNAMKGSRHSQHAVGVGQVSFVNVSDTPAYLSGLLLASHLGDKIRVEPPAGEDLQSPSPPQSPEMPSVVRVRSRSSRETTPSPGGKRTKLTINSREDDDDINPDTSPHGDASRNDEEDVEATSSIEAECESQDLFGMEQDQPETENLQVSTVATDIAVQRKDDNVERENADEAAVVVEEVMDIQLSVGVRAGVEMTLEGDDNTRPVDEDRVNQSKLVVNTEDDDINPDTSPHMDPSRKDEEDVKPTSSTEAKCGSQNSVNVEQGQLNTETLQASTVARDVIVHENDDSVTREKADEAAVVVEEVVDVQLSVGVRCEVDMTLDEDETTSLVDKNYVEENDEVVKKAKTKSPRSDKHQQNKSAEGSLGQEKADTQGVDVRQEKMAVDDEQTAKDTEQEDDRSTTNESHSKSVATEELPGDASLERQTGSQQALEQSARHVRRRRGKADEGGSHEETRKEIEIPAEAKPASTLEQGTEMKAETRQGQCRCLPFVVVLIALTMAILVAIFVKDLSLPLKVWLIVLPSAALLLMTVTELQR